MKRILWLALIAPGLAFLTGCSTSEHGPYSPIQTANSLEDTARFVLLDKGVQQAVTCPGIQEARLQDGRLQVTANVRNLLNKRLQVQMNCAFKDTQGFVVENTPYQNVILDENAQESVAFVSANDRPQRYTIHVREAR